MDIEPSDSSRPASMYVRVFRDMLGQLKNFLSKIEEKRRDNLNIAFPFWRVVQKLIYATFYLPWVLLAAIIHPEKTEYFIYSSCITMLLDPLFLYVPLINEETKCLRPDKALMTAALILRTITDLRYVSKILHKIKQWWGKYKGKFIEKIGITSNMVAILPIPQVALLVFLPNLRGSGSMTIMKCLNSLIFFQYVQRAYPIYRYCKNLNKLMHDKRSSPTPDWIPSLANLLIYLLASHVLGSFWYLFSVQRELDCWKDACQKEKSCEFDVRCDANTFRNVTFLHSSCPINSPNATIYDFGIFLSALQSGMQESTDLTEKFLICFSWGVRNLSSFASNLHTSNYRWEILFVVAISINGLLLFIYFLGHVQTFMQVAGKSKMSRQKLEGLRPKVEIMLDDYLKLYHIPADAQANVLKSSINYVLEKKHIEDPDLVLENMSSIFSIKHEVDEERLQGELNTIRETLFLEKLKHELNLISGLQVEETVVKKICMHLDPVIYPKGSYIIREGEPADMMFFITQGIALSYTNKHSVPITRLEKGECYGKEILSWAATASTSFSDLPITLHTVKAHKNVEIFALQAADLQWVLSHPPRPKNDLLNTTTTIVQGRNVSPWPHFNHEFI
ncbi:hypothetical protein ACLB2K_060401 [Fragaria x ananassa]